MDILYRIPCTIEHIPDGYAPAYILTLSRADLPRLLSLVERIKDGSYKGVELAETDKKVCRICCQDGLLTFVFADVTMRLNENDDEVFRLFLADMTADVPRYDHIDLEIRDVGIDLTVRVER